MYLIRLFIMLRKMYSVRYYNITFIRICKTVIKRVCDLREENYFEK